MSRGTSTYPVPPDFLVVGKVLRPWGLRGHVRVECISEFPWRFRAKSRFLIKGESYICETSRRLRHIAFLKFQGIDSPEQARSLAGLDLEVPIEEVPPLPSGRYYQFQVIGLEVWTTQGEWLGCVTDILATGSNDVYIVKGEGSEVLIPAIADVVKELNPRAGRITVEAIPGLL
jgi:16S rRNA processing protein RimM